MENFLGGGVAELEKAKADIMAGRELSIAADEAEKALRAKEKDVETQKKYMTDKIESTIRSRRVELEKSHDEVIHGASKRLKEAERNKKTAKMDAVNARVKNETAELVEENKHLNRENKDLFKQWKMPGFCNTSYYYAMFSPRHAHEFLIFAATVIIAIALIPNIVCLLLNVTTAVKIIIYIAIVVFFLLIYFLILLLTRGGAKAKVVEKGRPNRDQIRANKKKIKQLAKSIRKDDDEEQYGLGEFDAEIEKERDAVAEAMEKKAEALKAFDAETAVEIKDEIEKENVPIIQNMEQEAKDLKEAALAKRADAQEAATAITENYQSYLGDKNLNPEKIDELIKLFDDGQATTIMQALDLQKGEIK
ncbi:MAG: hypothetical protein IKH67_03655 [Lachnospiraceae bacterium]|nr:hypothetical protein [Lachnospiraceae bacterium]MBR6350225.1 hypothetical protein [Lachnospiraceae bacterium]